MDCLAGCWRAPLILHLLPINAGVKMQSILWLAWPPPGRSSTLKIACGSNIEDIRGNTTLVANCWYFRKFNYSIFFEILFLGWCPMLQLSKKISLKPDTERRKYARFSGLVPFFACIFHGYVDCLTGCWRAPLILHLLPLNAGVKMHSILWWAWPPPGRSSTLKIACRSNIDDILGNTTLVANCLYFQKI